MDRRRQTWAAMMAVVGVLAAACGPAAPSPTTTTTTTTAVPEPASVQVVLSQPSPGLDTTIISGQSAPLEYQLTVTNSGDEPSGPVVVTDTVAWPTTLIADSVSCETTPDCEVTVDGATTTWALGDIAPRSTHTLSFAAEVALTFGSATTITNSASFTNVATPGCTTATCSTAPLTNAAEEFNFSQPGGGWITPGNVVFFSGLNSFRAGGWTTNDPEAELTYEWGCIPDYLCYVTDQVEDRVTYNLVYDRRRTRTS